jgi:SAM-dependent methyltransferase
MPRPPENAQYDDPRLVACYDALNAGEHDYRFYEGLIGAAPCRIADIGCGSGTFALRLAALGHDVVAVDPATAMLARAAVRPGAERVRWRYGGVEALADDVSFDVAVMTGHAFQCLLDDDAVRALLRGVAARLRVGGRFLFESRNPHVQPWRGWHARQTRREVESTQGEAVEVWTEYRARHGDSVTFDQYYRFASSGEVLCSRSRLRFMPRERIVACVLEAGLGVENVHGNWDGSGWTPDSPEIIVVARR